MADGTDPDARTPGDLSAAGAAPTHSPDDPGAHGASPVEVRDPDAPEDRPPGGAAHADVRRAPRRVPRRRRRRHRVWPWVAGVVVVLAVLGGWSAVSAWRARADLLAVRDDVANLRAQPLGDRAEVRTRLQADLDRLDRAHDRLRQPGPRLVAAVPIVGRSLRAESAVADAAGAVARAADTALKGMDAVRTPDGGVDGGALRDLAAQLNRSSEETTRAMDRLRDVRTGLTPSPVGDAVSAARDELRGLDTTVARGAAAAAALPGLLGADGPRTVLLALQNNAELRGTGGLITSYAVGTINGGHISMGPFQDASADPVNSDVRKAVTVPAPPDVTANYGQYRADSTFLIQSNMAADVPSSAATLAAAVEGRGAPHIDTVVLIDVPGLAAVASATGPVEVSPGVDVSGDDLEKALLVDAYAKADESGTDQNTRRQALQAAAGRALESLLSDGMPSADLLRQLSALPSERHLALWSSDPEVQGDLVRAALAGDVAPGTGDFLMVTANNLSGDKLNYYVHRDIDVAVVLGRDSADVTRTVTLTLDAPDELPSYVRGGTDRTTIELRDLLDLAVPQTATIMGLTLDGQQVPTAVRTETGSRRVLAFPDLTNGAHQTWQLHYTVPVHDGAYSLRAVPQPLANDAHLTLSVKPVDGEHIEGGPVHIDAPFSAERTVTATLADRGSWWSRKVPIG